MPAKPTLPDPQDRTDAGPGLAPDQLRILSSVIRGIGRSERPAYRGGRAYPRLAGEGC